MPRLALLTISLVALVGCNEPNTEFCKNQNNADDPICKKGGPCANNSDCTSMASFPVCDTRQSGGTCVQCIAKEQCGGLTPVCTNDVCVRCATHADCPESNACMPDGSCALSSDVAYVDGSLGVDGAPCTKNMPCTKIDVAAGLKNIVKVSGTVQDRCSLNGKTTTVLADPGAKLMPPAPPAPANDGVAFEIKGASHVEVYDLEINHATGGTAKNGSGVLVSDTAEVLMTRVRLIDNTLDGAQVTGGHLTCTLCTIAQNDNLGVNVSGGLLSINQSTLRDNVGGGITISTNGTFQIVGNIIFSNGRNDKVTGGVNINVNGSNVNRLDFNSLSHNTATNGVGQGIQCISGMPLTANNNIVWANGISLPQVLGGCTYAYSDIDSTPPQTGTNMTVDPHFQNEGTGDLHLMSSSPVRRMADPAAVLSGLAAHDIDGDSRVSRADLGADQTP